MTYEFTTKAEYLTATTMWKADFKAHIQAIRKLKLDFKTAQRAFSKAGGDREYDYRWSQAVKDAYYAAYRPQEDLRSALNKSKERTSELHTIRYEMKAEAQRQYLKRTVLE